MAGERTTGTGGTGASAGGDDDPSTRAAPALRERLRLMVLTRQRPGSGRSLQEVVRASVEAGATAVQLRHPGASATRLLRDARELLPVVRDHGALLLVNDRLDVALAAGADGVHLGPDDLPVATTRSVVPDDFLVGYSCDDPEEAIEAARAGADYLGVGAVYGTRSKEGLEDEAIGPERVGRVLRAAGLPGVGIGGITADNAGPVYREGAGVAVLSAVMDADDPAAVVRAILAAAGGQGARPVT